MTAREIIFYIIMESIDKQVTKKDKWKKNDEHLRLSDILEYATPKNDLNFSTIFYEVVACSYHHILKELPLEVSFEIMKILNPTKEEIYRLTGDPDEEIYTFSGDPEIEDYPDRLVNYEFVRKYLKSMG